METTKATAKALYHHSFVRYVAIGGSTFVIDFGLLVLLHSELGINVLVAASMSYWIAIIYNFLANRFWTFEATETHITKHVVAYSILLGINYLFTIAFIAVATHFGMVYTLAKVLAVAIQMSWTYIAYRNVVFR